ncbi:MAG: DUF4266 domain-containing protein [Halioglobus sp.]|nr:DUF4266 domain-containing protein [Halioglobus sp.]
MTVFKPRFTPGLLAILVFATSACAPVRFNERERLSQPDMVFDSDPLQAEMRGHIYTPREAAIGGGAGDAGGCGCH